MPQALTYLVDDVSRRFGTIRVGAAESFLRSDDETALTELVHHPRPRLRLRRIAPTVVVSDVPLDVLLPRLRELGSAPVVEAPDGTVRLARREAMRARTPRRRQARRPGPSRDRRAPAPGSPPGWPPPSPRSGPATGRPSTARPRPARLRADDAGLDAGPAAGGGRDRLHGVDRVRRQPRLLAERVVDPVKVEAGWLSAYDHRTEDVRSFAVHRITAVRRIDG